MGKPSLVQRENGSLVPFYCSHSRNASLIAYVSYAQGYVKYFAEKLREDNSIFKQQKMLIESQLKSSSELFRKRLGTGKDFIVIG